MLLTVMKSKIHRATVTEADLNYEGSISLDPQLIKKAGFHVNEKVDIYDCNNGARFSTYVIVGKKGQVCLNGAAARMVQKGDIVIIVAYGIVDEVVAAKHEPVVVFVDEKNRIKETRLEDSKFNRKKKY
ncbi:MAG: aspartate 1-decarboxylase [Bdellovibrionota bacterium]